MGIYLDKVTILGEERAISGVIVCNGVALRHTLGEGSLLFGYLYFYECTNVGQYFSVWIGCQWVTIEVSVAQCCRCTPFSMLFCQFAFAKHLKSEKNGGKNSENSRPFSDPDQGAQALQSLTCPTSSTCNLCAFVGLMRLS